MLQSLIRAKYDNETTRNRPMEKLSLLGLDDQPDKKANKLSGGQQQRVAIARALINEQTYMLVTNVIQLHKPDRNIQLHDAEVVQVA